MTVKRTARTALFAAITLITLAQAFQPTVTSGSRVVKHDRYQSFRRISARPSNKHQNKHGTRSLSISMARVLDFHEDSVGKPLKSSLFNKRIKPTLKKLRQSFTILLASLAIFLSSSHIHTHPAHASTAAIASKTSTSLLSKINPFRPRTSTELIDKYVRDRLFADDEFDPVESAYREAFSDYPTTGDSGYYPSLLSDTAASALGRKDGSSLVLSQSTTASESDTQGITGALMKASDFLQQKLKVSSSVSYYMIAAGLLVGGTVLPGIVGMSYQAFQRLQIDKSEMKMYGKITDIAANAKKVTEDDKSGDEEEDDDDDDADEDEEGDDE